jgi:hypothetical protein
VEHFNSSRGSAIPPIDLEEIRKGLGQGGENNKVKEAHM